VTQTVNNALKFLYTIRTFTWNGNQALQSRTFSDTAEPTLMTESGKEALLAGGEFPIPGYERWQWISTVPCSLRSSGFRLSFTPFWLLTAQST